MMREPGDEEHERIGVEGATLRRRCGEHARQETETDIDADEGERVVHEGTRGQRERLVQLHGLGGHEVVEIDGRGEDRHGDELIQIEARIGGNGPGDEADGRVRPVVGERVQQALAHAAQRAQHLDDADKVDGEVVAAQADEHKSDARHLHKRRRGNVCHHQRRRVVNLVHISTSE